MERWVCARRTVTGDPVRLRAELLQAVPEVMQAATGVSLTPPAGDGTFEVRLATRMGTVAVNKWVRVHLGEATTTDTWVGIPTRWEASGGRHLFPTFDGSVELETLDRNLVELAVVGRYDPPLGPIGGLGDGTVFADVAQRTAERLVRGMAQALQDRVHGEVPPTHTRIGAITVGDVMSAELLTFTTDTPLRAAASLLLRAGISGAPVTDERGKVVGILSEQDLLDKATDVPRGLGRTADERYRRYVSTTVGEAASRPALTTEADTPVREAARVMAEHRVARLVVMQGATVAGIVTRTDVLKALVRDTDDIAAAVGQVLASIEEREVQVDVDGGVVRLGGTVATRSRLREVVDLVAGVDGVLQVLGDDLSFEVDDVTPLTGLGAFGP